MGKLLYWQLSFREATDNLENRFFYNFTILHFRILSYIFYILQSLTMPFVDKKVKIKSPHLKAD